MADLRGYVEGLINFGGDGTNVVANPTGTPTDDLDSIQIGNTIYNVGAGGEEIVPTPTNSDRGKYLGVKSNANELEYREVREMPTYSELDNNKVLTLVNGIPTWKEKATQLSQSEYNNLPTSTKENGDIYMIIDEGSDISTPYDMSVGSKYGEGNMSFNASVDNVISVWDGGGSIGGDWRFTTAIDVTNVDRIDFNIVTRTCYAHTSSNVEEQTTERFVNTLYLFRTMPTGYAYDTESTALKYLKFKYTNTDYGTQSIDVSDITGNIYIVWSSTGWNATLSNISLITASSPVNKIYYKGVEYANTQ